MRVPPWGPRVGWNRLADLRRWKPRWALSRVGGQGLGGAEGQCCSSQRSPGVPLAAVTKEWSIAVRAGFAP